jgi:hypothetical protein
MKVAHATLRSFSPYSQSGCHNTEKKEKENYDDYEKRTWRERLHISHDGHVFIPPMAFKNCLSEAAKYLSMQIQGKGKATYTKHFEGGVMVIDGLPLPVMKDDAEGEWLFLPANGRRGDGKRVWKCYPKIPEWEGVVTFHILDDTVTKEVFQYHLEQAGKFIGIGRFRPRNNGYYGRFLVEGIEWEDHEE